MDVGSNPEPLVLDFELTRTPPPLVRVRQWARTTLPHLGDDHIHAVVLVATELVTNAYEHGNGPTRIRLEHNRAPCWVRLEVDDRSPEPPVVGHSRLDGHRGRGLIIVDKLATTWGTRPGDDGKTVWVEISCHAGNDIPPCPRQDR
jgi:anti-sigma regulatory factor (Ser/Thr protein kinase)